MAEKKQKNSFLWDDLMNLIKKLDRVNKQWSIGEREKAIQIFNDEVSLYDDSSFNSKYVERVLKSRLPFLKKLKRDNKHIKGLDQIDYSTYFSQITKGFLWDIGW